MRKIYKFLLSFVCFLLSFTVCAEQTNLNDQDVDQIPDETADIDMDDSDDTDESKPDIDYYDPYGDPNNYNEMPCAYGPGPCSITFID